MKKKLVLLSLLAILLIFPMAAFAQNSASLSSVSVDLWPEFDRPSMLVIYHITLSSQVTLPYQMGIRIPTSAGSPHAVAVRQPDGALISIPFQQEAGANGWTRIVFQATTPDIQLEYYDPGLQKDQSLRRFNYTWPGDYSADNFNIEVQRPSGASEMKIKPGTVSARQGNDGLTYYSINVGPLQEGQVFEISIEYQKDTDKLSVSDMPVEASAPLDGSSLESVSISNILPVLLGILGFVLIAGGAYWYWQSGHQKERPKRETRGRRKPSPPVIPQEEEEDHQVYCHQCGRRASPGDRFCRACGTPLRIN